MWAHFVPLKPERIAEYSAKMVNAGARIQRVECDEGGNMFKAPFKKYRIILDNNGGEHGASPYFVSLMAHFEPPPLLPVGAASRNGFVVNGRTTKGSNKWVRPPSPLPEVFVLYSEET